MRFLHLGDLHIGKAVSNFSMADDQIYILDEICRIAEEEKADALLISGDIYDKEVPSARAVCIFDDFIVKISRIVSKIYIISGNHDSSDRLSFANRLLKHNGVYIAGDYNEDKPYELFTDEYGDVKIYMLPYLRHNEAIRISGGEGGSYGTAIWDIIKKTGASKGERNILMAHLFVTDGEKKPYLSESEFLPQNVGTIDSVDVSAFDCFNYVALGHLHRPQHIGRQTVRYSGSPLCYSRSEAQEYTVDSHDFSLKRTHSHTDNVSIEKSVPVVTMDGDGNVSIKLAPLVAEKQMLAIRGSINDICRAGLNRDLCRKNDYVYAVLTDEGILVNPIARLRSVFPNAMPPVFAALNNSEKDERLRASVDDEDMELSVGDLFKKYAAMIIGESINPQEEKFIDSIAQEQEKTEGEN